MRNKFLFFLAIFCLFFGISYIANNVFVFDEVKTNTFSCQSFQSDCEIMLGGQLYSINFDRNVFYTEQTVTMMIKPVYSAENLAIKNLTGFAEGITMYMGKVPLLFQHVDNLDKHQQYKTTITFGSCTENEMIWRIWLGINQQQSKIILEKDKLIDRNYIDVTVLRR